MKRGRRPKARDTSGKPVTRKSSSGSSRPLKRRAHEADHISGALKATVVQAARRRPPTREHEINGEERCYAGGERECRPNDPHFDFIEKIGESVWRLLVVCALDGR